jgi:hypothetical protein
MGTVIQWYLPKRSTIALPNLLTFLDPQGMLRRTESDELTLE